jgi:deoxyguanosinetriphosphate triphosphohydrolase, putative
MPLLREQIEKWENDYLSPLATKSNDLDYARRWQSEEPDPFRTCFQRDIGRILYSDAFRRLRTKTQVFTNPDHQHNRTRLTHSLEVAHIARQISRALSLNEDLTEAIALGHDLGHTPFGHAGEKALNEILKEKDGFSHNVQSLWLVEKTYPGRIMNGKPIPGYNLTYAAREGILKHSKIKAQRSLDILKKFDIEKPPTLEGQVVDLADGLAYLYHDAKDGQRNGLISEQDILDTWKNVTGEYNSDWFSVLIADVIETSCDKDIIKFSDTIRKAYDELSKLVMEKVILSSEVIESDRKCAGLVYDMYGLLSQNEELLTQRINKNKIQFYGLDRAIIDYIQWLGDQNFENTLKNLRGRAKKYKIANKL